MGASLSGDSRAISNGGNRAAGGARAGPSAGGGLPDADGAPGGRAFAEAVREVRGVAVAEPERVIEGEGPHELEALDGVVDGRRAVAAVVDALDDEVAVELALEVVRGALEVDGADVVAAPADQDGHAMGGVVVAAH